MTDQTSLSSLCSICNTSKSKYRCPGCAARTCSLSCYKRHQQWAQCSGKRDPARYVKKSQLATPAGVDHDYNYLTNIERDMRRADREVNDRLVGSQDNASRNPRNKLSDSVLAAAGVEVIRAPKGLSRQRENKSRLNSKKTNITWTVEWLHNDKTRLLSEASEHMSLKEAYRCILGTRPEEVSKKRKRSLEDLQKQPQNAPHVFLDEARVEDNAVSEKTKLPSSGRQPTPERTEGPSSKISEAPIEMADKTNTGHDIDGPESQSVSTQHHFFLLRPRTSSSRRVLIPVSSSSTLRECLRGRTILEFPTIYVLPSSSSLSEEFVLEEDYIREAGDEQKELETMLKDHPEALRAIGGEYELEGPAEEIDPKRILDVLKQDLGGAKI